MLNIISSWFWFFRRKEEKLEQAHLWISDKFTWKIIKKWKFECGKFNLQHDSCMKQIVNEELIKNLWLQSDYFQNSNCCLMVSLSEARKSVMLIESSPILTYYVMIINIPACDSFVSNRVNIFSSRQVFLWRHSSQYTGFESTWSDETPLTCKDSTMTNRW